MGNYLVKSTTADGQDIWIRLDAANSREADERALEAGYSGQVLGSLDRGDHDYIGRSTENFVTRSPSKVYRLMGGGRVEDMAGKVISVGSGDPGGPEKPEFRPDIPGGSGAEPYLPEEISGPSGAFDRALQSIGYDKGVLGSIGKSKFTDLNALATLGRAGGRNTEMFQNLGTGREMQDFFSKALGRLSGGRDPNATAAFDLGGAATSLFDQDVGVDSGLYNFFNPQLAMGRGDAGVGEGLSGFDAGQLVAELGLAGIGKKNFGGAFSRLLPDAQTLVRGFQSQAMDSPTAQSDIRAYIRDRLTPRG